jgi:hypothetical protein
MIGFALICNKMSGHTGVGEVTWKIRRAGIHRILR